MKIESEKYLTAKYVSYKGILKRFKVSDNILQPMFEAFTNSIEAIKLLEKSLGIDSQGKIVLRYYISQNLKLDDNPNEFIKLEIEDNGIGFDDIEFARLQALNDESKGFNNKGSGRIQFLHFFNYTSYESVYIDPKSPTGFSLRQFTLSKSKAFLDKQAIIRLEKKEPINAKDTRTKVVFRNLIIDKPNYRATYNNQTITTLKKELITHYLPDFCENRNHLPAIKLEFYINDILTENVGINVKDIPKVDKRKVVKIGYSTFSADGKQIIKSDKIETFNLKAYRIDKEQLAENSLKLVSKGEIAQSYPLQSLGESDHIDNHRYLFLLSGNYLTSKDGDNRGELNIPTKEEFKKQMSDMYAEREVILLDDIKEKTNKTIESIYEEIKQQKEEKERNIAELQRMFLLDKEHLKNIKVGINDTDDQILNKVYEADARIAAKRDAFLKHQVSEIIKLNPTADNYDVDLMTQVDELVRTIPLQNRTTLTKYVARRKLVLDIFDKVLQKQLEIQSSTKRNIDEKLLHNLIFQQSSEKPEESDLWLINEDFIYFKGNSEIKLNEIEINGLPLFKEEFSKEEEEYLSALGENRKIKKPDVLLFPDEGKCIIIEFKNPGVNVGEHLNQINRYASLILNFSNDEFHFDTFYGYLIGQEIYNRDVRAFDGDFKPSYQFDYLFRPSKTIPGDGNRSDGSLYTEVIKYTTLLERATRRNKIFIDKLTTKD